MDRDVDLLRAARHDADAFCSFYERHALRLRNQLRAEIGIREVANDLTAETFAQALLSLHRFRGRNDDAAAAWLYGIARNLVHQYHRRERVAAAARERLDMPVRDYGEFDETEELESARALSRPLNEAVDGLSTGERAALQLRVVEELSYEEVAGRLAIGVPAARMRVSRALRSVHTRLKGVDA